MSLKKAYLIVILVLLADQISKIYVKTHFMHDGFTEVFSWFRIQFIENEGMAWGTKIPAWLGGKITLTLFRIGAVGLIGWWLWDSVKKKQSPYLITSIALILAGAFGNIIDSVFYGVIFEHSMGQVAEFSTANHYGKLFEGKVVDMLYFPIVKGSDGNTLFFNAIFNLADAAISVGVGILIVFNKKAFPKAE
ncbi:lipoprotein signal peptidase [Flavobacterium akiainvivens]|uniref:Lipoprotein signal peptidase n=1 Tax=Flavobacterium akiainvivens TaxID=1202724 RepID=A0A0M8MJG6_9FLAO|nr:lipoprotein signal peptidase [Flavobacterium akiainvivens]KOS06818.1 lipoprotein signal peptidase [Flavobacterium akiainvivens]SFQ75227.1 signal peptidase II [Flavobacterium akiainvivens]